MEWEPVHMDFASMWFAFYSKYSEKTLESMKQENDKI